MKNDLKSVNPRVEKNNLSRIINIYLLTLVIKRV